jgi:predicted SprT family Zn-dependent metalloprotease
MYTPGEAFDLTSGGTRPHQWAAKKREVGKTLGGRRALDLREAERLAADLMRRHGLTDKGWALRFNNRRKALGIAVKHRGKRWIGLSLPFVRLNPPENVREVVLHEIAHALRGVEHGHDRQWRLIARSIGASGRSWYGEPIIVPKGIGRWVCDVCGSSSEIYRKPKSGVRYSCRQCLRRHGDTRANHFRFAMKLIYYSGRR